MLQGRGGVRFLGFRGWEDPFSAFQGRPSSHVWGLAGSWGNAPAGAGGMHRGGLHYPLFKVIE